MSVRTAPGWLVWMLVALASAALVAACNGNGNIESESENFEPVLLPPSTTTDGVEYLASRQLTSVWIMGSGSSELHAFCTEGEPGLAIFYLSPKVVMPNPMVEWSIDDGPVQSSSFDWEVVPEGISASAYANDLEAFRKAIQGANVIILWFEDGTDQWHAVRFVVTGFFDTPVQPNLDHCGEY